jgi:tRNA threonylcarbamoyladenosine biosynthesis protein TsaE
MMTEVQLQNLAREMALKACCPQVICLWGDLGTGKSTFARAFVRALMEDNALDVPSPTFNLVQIFDSPKGELWHCDLYRLKNPQEIEPLGLLEAFNSCICIIEWPQRLEYFLPPKRIDIKLLHRDEHSRSVEVVGV